MSDAAVDRRTWTEAVLDTPRTRAGAAVLLDRADVDQYGSIADVLAYAGLRRWRVLECGNDVIILPGSCLIKRHL